MLRRLYIRDYVIVDMLELEFAPGFGALTGETGAGKSILVDALSLALGERADAASVRSGCDKAEISAEFAVTTGSPLAAWLRANDFDDDACLLRRVIEGNGRSRGYINGVPATLSQMREAADFLADIHGQHAHHSLLRADAQRQLLDGLADLGPLAEAVASLHAAWRKAKEARLAAEKNAEANAREREMLTWQVKEVSGLGFDAGAWAETVIEHKRLAHAASLQTGVEEALEGLSEGEQAAMWQVERIGARLRQLIDYDPSLKGTLEVIEGAQIQLQEAAHALRHYRDRVDVDPARLGEVESHMRAVHDAARKYRVQPEELPGLLASWGARLIELETLQDAAVLADREAQARQAYLAKAEMLGKGRRKSAASLDKAVTEAMQQLAMPGGRFEVAFEKLPESAAHGLENVEFRVSAHAGQPLGALSRVASGGELSRIGLAIQVIASAAGKVPTLVFDEVDVGIGGGVAEIVGRLLKQLGGERQVLCVTHLPQVAAQADWQWTIAKEEAGKGVVSRVTPLDRDGRIEEIARMLGGVKITPTTRKHAAEMLGY
ncbi:MAG: DNA repair protein RecN [Rhodocyclaceae bacterium]|jgi:DNA repair protein RecN (Recombination protein N)|nr:DNA repair protein RecN [Rhodocyclaceae bacterium]MBZ0145385.1 DNA repair protein RecN [Rhodocyclaceae bacterium]MCC6879978.1 DNA repair protein RecN [Rhodocyclaceae bacterium]MCL4679715.1 DNA repair protein RecN [Rhodocyclaceae bacterium]